MYKYQRSHTGLGQIHSANVNIFEGGIGVSPPAAPRTYRGLVPARIDIFGSGRSVLPARAPSPVVGIEACATGNCPPLGFGTVNGTNGTSVNGRPWWHYALFGAGVGLGYVYLQRSGLLRNPDRLSPAEIIRQAAAITIQAGIPTILWGPPGIGKTKWIQGLGDAMAPMNGGKPVEVITVIGSTKDPTDIGGMPSLKGGTWAPPWVEKLSERSEDDLHSILFLDEFSSITPIVHAALLRVVNEKIAADVDFDPEDKYVHIVMAANRRKHGASAADLPAPAANRIIHFEWPTPTAFDWAKGMLGVKWRSEFYYTLPSDWKQRPRAREGILIIAAFLRYHQWRHGTDLLFQIPEIHEMGEEDNRLISGPWPSPRSWDLAGNAIGACLVAGAPMSVQKAVVAGAVGDYAAMRLTEFRERLNIPLESAMILDIEPRQWPEHLLDSLETPVEAEEDIEAEIEEEAE